VTGAPALLAPRTVRAGVATGAVVRCTATDSLLAGMAMSTVFLYERAPDLARLEAGLAAALARVPVFAGRLRAGGDGALEIVCDDAGVAFTVVDVPETLPEALGRMTLPTAGYADPVDVGRDRPPDAPLLTVRASRLGDGGLALGCTWHHSVGDLQSLMLLLQSWSAAVEGRPGPEVQQVEDREGFLDAALPGDSGRPGFRLPAAAEGEELTEALRAVARANRTVQVFFTAAEVDRMRAAYGAETGLRLSANDVLAGHIVGAVRRLDGDAEGRRLVMPVNVRRFLDLPASVLGNIVSEINLGFPTGVRPAELAGLVRGAVDGFVGSHLNVRANRTFLDGIGLDRLWDTMPVGFDPAGRAFSVTNWCRAGTYDITFGGPRPAYFGPQVSLPVPWASWVTEGFGGDGYLVTVVLPARLAPKLRTESGLHAYREDGEVLPPLAAQVRKLG
jgi:hypothetical protein